MTILGHERVVDAMLAAMHSPSPPHAWLMAGSRGVGKGSLARDFGAHLLASAVDPQLSSETLALSPDHPTAHLLAARAHPDFRLVQRLPKDEKLHNKPQEEWPEGFERARSISVQQVRDLTGSFSNKPSLSQTRVVVIDAIDDLETAAANALLKTLEEPPLGTIFLLVSHSPARLLPTIRSRCRLVRFSAVSDDIMTSVLGRALPEMTSDEIRTLVELGQGSPGKALGFAVGSTGKIVAALDDLAASGDDQLTLRNKLVQMLSPKAAAADYEMFLRLAPARIARAARQAAASELPDVIALWEKARDTAQMAIPSSYDPTAIILVLCELVAALAPRQRGAKA